MSKQNFQSNRAKQGKKTIINLDKLLRTCMTSYLLHKMSLKNQRKILISKQVISELAENVTFYILYRS